MRKAWLHSAREGYLQPNERDTIIFRNMKAKGEVPKPLQTVMLFECSMAFKYILAADAKKRRQYMPPMMIETVA